MPNSSGHNMAPNQFLVSEMFQYRDKDIFWMSRDQERKACGAIAASRIYKSARNLNATRGRSEELPFKTNI